MKQLSRIRDQKKFQVAVLISALALLMTSHLSWNYFDLHLFLLTWNESLVRDWNIYAVGNSNYPPLATYLFITLETFARRTANNPLVTTTALTEINWVRIVARVPLILAYLWTGRLMYRRWGWDVARYWLFTPPVLLAALLVQVHPAFTVLTLLSWTSLIPLHVFFGYQFDLLVVPFTLLALFSLQDESPGRFGLYLAIGTLIKFYPIILLPLGLIRFGWRRQMKVSVVFGGVVGLALLPFFLDAPHEVYYQLFGFQGQRFPQGLSIHHLPLLAVGYETSKFPNMLTWLWEVIWLPIYGILLLLAVSNVEDDDIVVAFSAILLSFVMMNKIGNLNYMIWSWPFILVLIERQNLSIRYVTALVVTTTMYPLLVYLPAAIADKPIFIIQKLQWFDSRILLLDSFQGSSYASMQRALYTLNDFVGPQAVVIYNHRFILLSLLIVAHATIQLQLIIGFANRLGGTRTLAQFVKNVRDRPVSVIRSIISDSPPE